MSATTLEIGIGKGGVGVSSTTLKTNFTYNATAEALYYILNNGHSPLYVQELVLETATHTTIPVPTQAGGVIIVPPDVATRQMTLKGADADTGIALAILAPAMINFGVTPPANIVLQWAAKSYQAEAVVVDPVGNTLSLAAHDFALGDRVEIDPSTTTVPEGLALGTWYYVVDSAAPLFKLGASAGGTVIDITTAGAAVKINNASKIKLLWL